MVAGDARIARRILHCADHRAVWTYALINILLGQGRESETQDEQRKKKSLFHGNAPLYEILRTGLWFLCTPSMPGRNPKRERI